jgi:hypothetical protein
MAMVPGPPKLLSVHTTVLSRAAAHAAHAMAGHEDQDIIAATTYQGCEAARPQVVSEYCIDAAAPQRAHVVLNAARNTHDSSRLEAAKCALSHQVEHHIGDGYDDGEHCELALRIQKAHGWVQEGAREEDATADHKAGLQTRHAQ